MPCVKNRRATICKTCHVVMLALWGLMLLLDAFLAILAFTFFPVPVSCFVVPYSSLYIFVQYISFECVRALHLVLSFSIFKKI